MLFIYFILIFAISYLIGTIPCGLALAKLFRLKEIPKNLDGYVSFGSLWQSKHWFLALLTPILEILKLCISLYIATKLDRLPFMHTFHDSIYICSGPICSFLKMNIFGRNIPIFIIIAYISIFACIIGQIFPYWNKFKGGTGMIWFFILAISLELNPTLLIIAIVIWSITLLLSHYICLANLSTVIAFPFILLAYPDIDLKYITFLALLVILGHRGHIARLLKGQEPKFSLWKKD